MNRYLNDAGRTIVPRRDDPHGPLPSLLVLLTVVTGLVDAFSYLLLGHVFVANMTGNVVFLSFALGGAAGFVWWASVLAIITFSVGAFIGGRIGRRHGGHRGRHLLVAMSVETAAVLIAFVVALAFPRPYGTTALIVLIVLLGIGLGIQNATARSLAVPDLTTTVLTLTITGISADSAAKGSRNGAIGRRVVSILSMFVGGLVGALLIAWGLGPWVLLIAAVLLGVVFVAAIRASRSVEKWTERR
jgi:uncharacterized membrane protein YoaK (UPF0700 family)